MDCLSDHYSKTDGINHCHPPRYSFFLIVIHEVYNSTDIANQNSQLATLCVKLSCLQYVC